VLRTADFGEVARIELSREMDGQPLYWTAAYLVGGLLIDTGCPHTASELISYLDGRRGRRERRVELAVNTHEHEDHIGANRLLQETCGLRVMAHPSAIPFIRCPPEIEEYRRATWGEAEPSEPLPLGESLSAGGYEFRVIHTPGHSPGHVALVEPERGWCFSGDLFVGEKPRVSRREEDFTALARSLVRLAGTETRTGDLTLFTGIGRVVEDGRRALLECVNHLRAMWQEARRLHQEGLEPAAVRDRLFGRESTFAFLTGAPASIFDFRKPDGPAASRGSPPARPGCLESPDGKGRRYTPPRPRPPFAESSNPRPSGAWGWRCGPSWGAVTSAWPPGRLARQAREG